MSTEAVLLDYQTVKAMAAVICEADTGKGIDAQGSAVRDRYVFVAEAVLRYSAHQVGVPTMEPIPGAGWRASDDAVAVGDPSGGEAGIPEGFEPVYRIGGS